MTGLFALFACVSVQTITVRQHPTRDHWNAGGHRKTSLGLGTIATDLPWGQAYGNFDNKILFLISVVVFEVGSAVCGAAPSLNALIVYLGIA